MCCAFSGLRFVISQSKNRIFSDIYEVRKGMTSICISLQHNLAITGDIRVDFYNFRPKMKRKVSVYLIFIFINLLNDTLECASFSGEVVSFLV